MKNWWYYHKWYVIIGIILVIITCRLIGNALGFFQKSPDLQIAYVGKIPLPPDTSAAIQKTFTSLAADYNHDGEIIVQVNQYIDGNDSRDVDTAYYQYASEITLIGDISDCESYLFLLENPADFQRTYQLLATIDGSCPDQSDYETADKIFQWSDCPVLAQMELGSYTDTALGQTTNGNNQDILSKLYLGRRCFYTDDVTEHVEECAKLWNMLYQSIPDDRKLGGNKNET